MLWEILKASKGILVADFYADLWANIAGGGTPVDVFVEMIGSLPLYYNGKGYDLTDYLISGNAVQDGTPSPDAPVDATGSGVRTGNLAPPLSEFISGYVDVNGNIHNASGIVQEKSSGYIQITPNTDYVFAFQNGEFPNGVSGPWRAVGIYDENKTFINRVGGNVSDPLIFNSGANAKFARLSYRSYGSNLNTMLNLGSTALPYEPYGFKLPLTVNATEYPIYLGQVETTRRIKKLVLTGEEDITSSHTDIGLYKIPVTDYLKIVATTTNVCSHYKASINVNGWFDVTDMSCCFYGNTSSPAKLLYIRDTSYTSIADFKAYLAQQYAAGTPVTVWYVLATPETAVVNEPLMKIGDYADTVGFAQAGVAIPTVSGANVLDMTSTVKPSEMYIKGKGIKPTGYGQLSDVNGVNVLDKDGRPIYVHGQ